MLLTASGEKTTLLRRKKSMQTSFSCLFSPHRRSFFLRRPCMYWNVYFMGRLDQRHPYPNLEVPRLEIEPGPPRWEASTPAKSYLNRLWIAVRNTYILASSMAPAVHVVAWTFMDTHELHHDVGRIALAIHSTLDIDIMQALASPRIHCQARQITSGSPIWRDLAKVISILI